MPSKRYEVERRGGLPRYTVTYDEARALADGWARGGSDAKVWRVADDALVYRTGRRSDEPMQRRSNV